MKTLFYLIISICLAAAFCWALAIGNVLEFRGVSSSVAEKYNPGQVVGKIVSPAGLNAAASEPAAPPVPAMENPAHAGALEFLKTMGNDISLRDRDGVEAVVVDESDAVHDLDAV